MNLRNFSYCLLSGFLLTAACKKDNPNPAPPPPTTKDPINSRLISGWRLMYIKKTEYVDGVKMTENMIYDEHAMDSMWFKKGDSCVFKIAGKYYYGNYTVKNNIVYTTPDSFSHIKIDSASYLIETYRLWLERPTRSLIDGEGKKHEFNELYFFVD
jgi:hypothetical protein